MRHYVLIDKTATPPMYRCFSGWTPERERAWSYALRVSASEERAELAAKGDEHAQRAEVEFLK
jgi:hypothetical protein